MIIQKFYIFDVSITGQPTKNREMRTLKQVFDSLVKSYNKKESLNFIDIRDLDELLTDRRLFDAFVKTYNQKESINFIQLRELESLV